MTHPSNPPKKQGFTIAEMLISLMIAGIFAVLLIPKVMTSPAERDAQMKDQTLSMVEQQLTLALMAYKDQNNLDNEQLRSDIGAGLATTGDIFYFYGNFFSYKAVNGNRYFYFSNKARLSFDLDYFSDGDYTAASIPGADETFCTAQTTANTGYCAAVDVNGKNGPNSAGANGDIQVFFIDATTFEVSRRS